MTLSEEQLSNWTKPGFDNEEERAEETKSRIQDAINKHPVLGDLSVKVFPKGSYANNTNVRRDSDIDIAVELEGLIKLDLSDGVTFGDLGLLPYTGITSEKYKQYVLEAILKEFGPGVIDSSGNKVFRIRGSRNILDADVIPCTSYRHYFTWGYRQGIQLILNNPDGKKHINYPVQHYEKGVQKNADTQKRYKRTVRILKNARNYLVESNGMPHYHSFMVESLAHNLSNEVYNDNNSWKDIIKSLCIEAWSYIKEDEPIQSNLRWCEVNRYKYLFHEDQKWTRNDAKEFIVQIYSLVGD